MAEVNRILLAVDGSKHSDQAVRWYLKHMHKTGNHVIAVHVVESTVYSHYAVRVTLQVAEEEYKDYAEEQKKKAKYLVETQTAFFHELGMKVKFMVLTGSTGSEIVRQAEADNCCVIVMGSRGAGYKGRGSAMGRVAEYVLNHSTKIPVAVGKHVEERRESITGEARPRRHSLAFIFGGGRRGSTVAGAEEKPAVTQL